MQAALCSLSACVRVFRCVWESCGLTAATHCPLVFAAFNGKGKKLIFLYLFLSLSLLVVHQGQRCGSSLSRNEWWGGEGGLC